jgi:hypothetical protein
MSNRWWLWAALGCAAIVVRSDQLTADEPAAASDVIDFVVESQASSDAAAAIQIARQYEAGAKYWIGVGCEPASESLRSQLGLEADKGLVVNEVMDGSPAKAAGIQPHDVLVSVLFTSDDSNAVAAEQMLADISQLSGSVQQSGGKPLSVVLVRKGKQQTVEVTPAERPQPEFTLLEANSFHIDIGKPPHNPEKVQELLRQLQEELGGGPQGTMRLHMTAPVVVAAPPQAPITFPAPAQGTVQGFVARVEKSGLPAGMTLTITKTGNNPARIEVKQGEGKIWGAKEDEIDTLPVEARELARAAIAGLSQPHSSHVKFWATPPAVPVAPPAPVSPKAPVTPHREVVRKVQQLELETLQKQIQELTAAQAKQAEAQQRQLRELQQALEKLTPKD